MVPKFVLAICIFAVIPGVLMTHSGFVVKNDKGHHIKINEVLHPLRKVGTVFRFGIIIIIINSTIL